MWKKHKGFPAHGCEWEPMLPHVLCEQVMFVLLSAVWVRRLHPISAHCYIGSNVILPSLISPFHICVMFGSDWS